MSSLHGVSNCYVFTFIKDIDVEKFRDTLLTTASWCLPLSSDPDSIAVQLDADLHTVLDDFAPMRTRTRRGGHRKTPRLTDDCILAKRDRRRLERRFARSRTDTDLTVYRRSCRNTSKLLRDALCSYIRQKLEDQQNNPSAVTHC